MDKCIYKDQILYAIDIAKKFKDEKIIRIASKNHELQCGDPECNQIVAFKRGEHRKAHFAHRSCDTKCDYDSYIKGKSQDYIEFKNILFEHFRNSLVNCRVEMDVKILSGHYSSIFVEIENGKSVVIEIGDKKTSANYMQSLSENYTKHKIVVDWIILDKINRNLSETDAYFIKRERLHNSLNKSTFVYDKDTNELMVYRLDETKYSEKYGNEYKKYDEYIWYEKIQTSDLSINENGIMAFNIEEKFNDYKARVIRSIEESIKDKKNYKIKQLNTNNLYIKPIITNNIDINNTNKPINNNNSDEFILENITIQAINMSIRHMGNYGMKDFLRLLDLAANKDEVAVKQLIRKMCEANDSEKEIFKEIYYSEQKRQNETPEGSKYFKILEHVRKEAVKIKRMSGIQ